MKVVSWNVNGLSSCLRSGFLHFLAIAQPEVVCCQEIKTMCHLNVPNYYQFWNVAQEPGYSGTLTLSRREPISCNKGMGIETLDAEGRLIVLEYEDYYIVNVYVPSINTHSDPERPRYRNMWEAALRKFLVGLPKPAII